MAPLASTQVVPEGWSRHHQPVASGGMNATCRVLDPARTVRGEWDDATGDYGPSAPHVVWPPAGVEGWPCRVQAIQSDEDTEQGGEESTTRRYLVQVHDPNLETVPDLRVGYDVVIMSAVNDDLLVGETLRVTDQQHGSERFTRDLVTVHNQQQQPAEVA